MSYPQYAVCRYFASHASTNKAHEAKNIETDKQGWLPTRQQMTAYNPIHTRQKNSKTACQGWHPPPGQVPVAGWLRHTNQSKKDDALSDLPTALSCLLPIVVVCVVR